MNHKKTVENYLCKKGKFLNLILKKGRQYEKIRLACFTRGIASSEIKFHFTKMRTVGDKGEKAYHIFIHLFFIYVSLSLSLSLYIYIYIYIYIKCVSVCMCIYTVYHKTEYTPHISADI